MTSPALDPVQLADDLARAAFEARGQLVAQYKNPASFSVAEWMACPEALRAAFRIMALSVVKRHAMLGGAGLSAVSPSAARAVAAPPTATASPAGGSPSGPVGAPASNLPGVPINPFAQLRDRVAELERRLAASEHEGGKSLEARVAKLEHDYRKLVETLVAERKKDQGRLQEIAEELTRHEARPADEAHQPRIVP